MSVSPSFRFLNYILILITPGQLTLNIHQRVRQFSLDVRCCEEGRGLISVGETVVGVLGTFAIIDFQVNHRSAQTGKNTNADNYAWLILSY